MHRPNITHAILAYLLCCLAIFALTALMLEKPGIFPMSGFAGPQEVRDNTPAGIRFTGGSWRYIEGGRKLISGKKLDPVQSSYRGYIALTAASLYINRTLQPLIVIQVLAAAAALFALMLMAHRANSAIPLPAAIATGALFAINPEFAAWHTAVMTESIYTSAVCIATVIALAATKGNYTWKMPLALLAIVAIALIRPTGWILIPAVLIFWILDKVKAKWAKLLATILVVAAFLLLAATKPFNDGINTQSPTIKLYKGEVVWNEDLWRLEMPPADMEKTSIADGLKYAIKNPIPSAHLALRRIVVMVLRIRPSYSFRHNAFLIAYHLPMTLLALLGMIIGRRKRHVQISSILVAAHALVVALTFNDNDGRFTLYITPLLDLLAVTGIAEIIVRKFNLEVPPSPADLFDLEEEEDLE